MAKSLERTPGVLSHDLYTEPTEQQMAMVKKLNKLQRQYAKLIDANPLFNMAVHTWVEEEHDDIGTLNALVQFKLELDAEVEGMTEEERASNPDADLHKMVKLRVDIATIKQNIENSSMVTGVNLEPYIEAA